MSDDIFLQKGKFSNLVSLQKAVIIQDCTSIFCQRFLTKNNHIYTEMTKAAQSGKQHLIENTKASAVYNGTEIKHLGIAHTSFEELLKYYQVFLRSGEIEIWEKSSAQASYTRSLCNGKTPPPIIPTIPDSSQSPMETLHQAFIHFLKTCPAGVCANIMICLVNQCNSLLDQQLKITARPSPTKVSLGS